MLWRKTQRQIAHRQGFTLIELLVVISIIAILMSLLMAAVMKAREVGPRADTTSRIAAVSNGIGQFKAQYNVPYIPAGGSINTGTGGYGTGFGLRNSYTAGSTPSINSFEAQYISQIFGPSVNLSGLGNPSFPNADNVPPIYLDSNQTLLFFLNGITSNNGSGVVFQGFSRNPQQPFAPWQSASEDRRKPLLDISTKHYTMAPKNYPLLTSNGFPWLVDGWGNPFVYFVSYNGKPNMYGGWYQGIGTGSPAYLGGPNGYFNGTDALGNHVAVNPSGFQLISAGADGIFGPGGNWQTITTAGVTAQDDRANFSTANLGAGPQ